MKKRLTVTIDACVYTVVLKLPRNVSISKIVNEYLKKEFCARGCKACPGLTEEKK